MLSWGTYRDSHGLIGWSKGVKKQPTPQPISFPKDIKISKIACGESHVLALTTQGVLFSWGSCEQGQLGFRPVLTGEFPEPAGHPGHYRGMEICLPAAERQQEDRQSPRIFVPV